MAPKPRTLWKIEGRFWHYQKKARRNELQLHVLDVLNSVRVGFSQMVYGHVEDVKIPGRKRKTSQRQDRIVVRKSKADRFKTAPQIKAETQIDYGVDI